MTLGENPVRVEGVSAGEVPPPQGRRCPRMAGGLGWVLGCFTLGAALIVLPWLWVWERCYFVTHGPGWAAVWLNPYLRGAVTGLGVVNVGISFYELRRLWKVWFPEEDRPS